MTKRDADYYKMVQASGEQLAKGIDLLVESGKYIDDETWLRDRAQTLEVIAKLNLGLRVVTNEYVKLGLEVSKNTPPTKNDGGLRFRD